MTRRGTIALLTIALFVFAGRARGQRASLAVGVASPLANLSNGSRAGFDADLQVRTEPIVAGLPLRIDIGVEALGGKGGNGNTTIYAQSISLMGDLGPMCYWVAGPGYYESSTRTQLSGHNVNEQRTYFGALAAVGMNIPVFRWDGFLEVAAVRLFSPGPTAAYLPLRFGIRL